MPRAKKEPDSKLAPTKLWEMIGRHPGKPWTPHNGQAEILSVLKTPWPSAPMSDGLAYPSIINANCGRQFGKTELGTAALWQGLTAPNDDVGPPQVRLTADTDEHANKVWDRFVWTAENTKLGQTLVKSHNKDRNLITLHTGATLQKVSGNNPQALSGDSVTLWVVDEAQFFTWAAWNNMLPSILARNGVILMLGVAQGDGPYREASRRGELENRREYPRYLTLRYSSYDNPYVKREAIDLMAQELSPIDYNNLILAQWDRVLGRVFHEPIKHVYRSDIHEYHDPSIPFRYTELPRAGHQYFGGLDIALVRDYTVYSIWDRDGKMIAWDRYHRLSDPREVIERIVKFSTFWGHPLTVPDETGMGIPMVADLRARGLRLQPYAITSNPAKKLLIDDLQRRFTNNWIQLPDDKDVKEEFALYEAKSAPGSTVVKFGAPSGKHDDIVMSAALAAQVLPKRRLILPPSYNADDFRSRGVWEDL